MANEKIKGIVVQIGGDTSGLSKALSEVNKNISSTQKQLKDVERLLKLDPKNTELLAQKQKLLAQATEETKQKLKSLKEANELAAGSAKNYDAWKQAYTPIKTEIDATSQKLQELRNRQKELEDIGQTDTTAYKEIQQEAQETAKELTVLKEQAKEVSNEFGNPISPQQFDALQREIQATEIDLKKLHKTIDEVMTEMGAKLERAGEKVSGMGKKMTPLSATIAGLGATAVQTSANFEKSMSEVEAISGATEQEMEALSAEAKRLGAETKFSASDAAQGLKYMAMAGWDTQQMLDGLESVMKLAIASGEDLGTVSDIVTDALTAFGLKAKDAAHFSDVLAMASSKSNTNVSMMGETFKYVAPVAGAMGYSIEDTAVAIGLMANAGIKGSQSGTSLRSMLTRLAAPPKEAATAMKALGISVTNSDGTMKTLQETMVDLRQAFSGLSEEQQAQYAKAIAGQEAMSGLLAIVNTSEEDFAKLTKEINNCNGAANRQAAIMHDNLAGKIEDLKSKVEGIAIALGEALTPMVEKVTEKISQFADWLSKLTPEQQEFIITIGAIVMAIGPLLIIMGKLITSIGVIIGLFPKIKAGFLFLSKTAIPNAINSISTLGTAIATKVTAAFTVLTNTVLPAIGSAFSTVFGFIAANPIVLLIAAIVGLVVLIAAKGDEIQAILQKVDDFLQNIFARDWAEVLGPVLGEILNGFFANIKNVWESVKQILNGIIDFIRGVFTGDWERAWQGVLGILKGMVNSLVTVIKTPINAIISLLNGMIGAVNWVIEKVNNISFKNPFTGETVDFDFPTIDKIPYLAKGGILSQGSAIVGEAGPELLTMLGGGQAKVTPLTSTANTTNNAYGGITIQVYTNDTNWDAAHEYGRILGQEAARTIRGKGIVI